MSNGTGIGAYARQFGLLGLLTAVSLLPFLLVALFPQAFYWVIPVAAYLVFHNAAEFFSVMVSLSVFGLGWFAFPRSRDRHALFLAAAFLAIGLTDFLHALGYAGMPDLVTPNTVNKASQYWIAARYLTALAFLTAAFLAPGRRAAWVSPGPLLAAALGLPALIFTAITFFPGQIPQTSVPGVGLTPFKVGSEYLIVALLLAAFGFYLRRMVRTGDRELVHLLAAFLLCILSELVFTLYKSAFDTYNMLGHLYKILAFALVYRNLYVTSIHRPYDQLKASNTQLQREIADRTRAEGEVRRALKEKETLVQELYHRTKNTIEVVRGMLVLQAAEVPEDRNVRTLVARTEERIQAISLVHDLLYSHQDLSQIPVREYVRALAELLVRESGAGGTRIALAFEVDDLPLLLDTAVPFGLILNELLTNSLRWAFPDGRQGTIAITVVRGGPGRVRFTYADDGIGLPGDFDADAVSTLGLSLVQSIGRQQMMGTIRFETGSGFRFALDFPDNLYGARV